MSGRTVILNAAKDLQACRDFRKGRRDSSLRSEVVNLSELVLNKGHVSISSLGFLIETGVLSYVLSERFTSSQNDAGCAQNDASKDFAVLRKTGGRWNRQRDQRSPKWADRERSCLQRREGVGVTAYEEDAYMASVGMQPDLQNKFTGCPWEC
jgi:hypothetical protein